MSDWLEEHIRTLSNLSGLSLDKARLLFQQDLYIALDPALRQNRTYLLAFSYAVNLLTRLFPTTRFDEIGGVPHLILPWGGTSPLTRGSRSTDTILVFGKVSTANNASRIVNANCHDWHIYVDLPLDPDLNEDWNPILALATACYAAARVTKILLGDAVDGPDRWQPFSILDFREGRVRFDWEESLPIGDVYLAGVGAIGSSALLGLAAHGAATGRLILVDHDPLDRSNLGRYSFFDTYDEGHNKAERAKLRIDGMGLNLTVEAVERRFENYFDEQQSKNPLFGIPRLLSAPDRRDIRRQFQSRLPREVWDASTGPDQVVLHHNRFDPELACLACIYPEDPIEHAHLRHVALTLDISYERVLSGEPITEEDAKRIRARYPHLPSESLIGRAFDSLFRELCAAGRLRGEDMGVLAPFSFISGLAGVLLYFEFVKSLRPDIFGPYQEYNYTQLNPFFPPNPDFRRLQRSRPGCSCQDRKVRKVFTKIWTDAPKLSTIGQR